MQRRDFLQMLAAASAAGLSLSPDATRAARAADALYDLPPFGNVHLLHFTDCHAQLLPSYYREPSMNLGAGKQVGKLPHLVGQAMLHAAGVAQGTAAAHALTALDFTAAARIYGKTGGFAHLATLVQRLRASRPGALLLDGGDTWQGSATALWTRGQDMIDAALALGVDVMTGHWEMTLGAERVREVVDHAFKGRIAFVAQNVHTSDFGDAVFDGYVLRHLNGAVVAVIGQAFPYTPIAHPRRFVPDWTFGIDEANLQKTIDEARARGAQVVVLLSHNGMDVDLKLATRVRGLDAILGGHTHDAIAKPVLVRHPDRTTIVTNAGSNGKFLGVLDFDVRDGQIRDYHYRLLPVFSRLLPADAAMQSLIDGVRAPYLARLDERLADNAELLYRRGNFNGSFDQLILDALRNVHDAPIAFSPGFRWGATVLPGDAIRMEDLLAQTAITYPQTTVSMLSGERIKAILEDVADNLFHPDPYLQQGGDMVRVAGLRYAIAPHAPAGQRIRDLRLNGEPLSPTRSYRVAGWASVADPDAQAEAGVSVGAPIWEVVATYLRGLGTVRGLRPEAPKLIGVGADPGIMPPG